MLGGFGHVWGFWEVLAGHGSPMLGSARRCESRIGSAQTSYSTLRRRGRYWHLHLLFKTFKFGGCPIHKHQPSITEGCFYIILTGVVRVLCISMVGQIRCADRGSSLDILRLILFASFTRFASGLHFRGELQWLVQERKTKGSIMFWSCIVVHFSQLWSLGWR